MSRKGENIYKRKDSRWEARVLVGYSPDGKRKYHSIYGKSYKEAKQKRQDYLFLHTMSERDYKYYLSRIPFEICANNWLDCQKSQVKPSTYSTYVRMVHGQLLPKLGWLSLNEISQELIRDFLTEKQLNGRLDGKGGLSSKTISDLIILLNRIFGYAYRQYGCSNPMESLKWPARRGEEMEPLSRRECQVLTQYLISHPTLESIGILSSLYMGLRLGEICAMKWENIDLERQIFKVRNTLYRVLREDGVTKTQLVLSAPKTSSSVRDVPIPKFMVTFLEGYVRRPEIYLLTDRASFIEPRTYQNHFKRVLKDCGLRDIPFHCLRHTFATNCVILDFDVKTLSEILGHSSTTITLERYVHSSLHQKQIQMAKISDSVTSALV